MTSCEFAREERDTATTSKANTASKASNASDASEACKHIHSTAICRAARTMSG